MAEQAGAPVTDGAIALRVIGPADHRVMLWKNGLGLTREIAIDPPQADLAGRFRWRLSIADVRQSGPFSAFEGCERTIMVIAGDGMELTVGDRPRRLDRPYEPYVFSGDKAAECRLLGGPIRDFNLVVRRSVLRSRLDVVRLDPAPRLLEYGPDSTILHCFEGSVEARFEIKPWSQNFAVEQTVVIDARRSGGGAMQLRALANRPAVLAVMQLTPA